MEVNQFTFFVAENNRCKKICNAQLIVLFACLQIWLLASIAHNLHAR